VPGEILPANTRFRLWFGNPDVVPFSLLDIRERVVPVAVTTTRLPQYSFHQSIIRPLRPLPPGVYSLVAEEKTEKFTVSSRIDSVPPAAPQNLTARIEEKEYTVFGSQEQRTYFPLSVSFQAAHDDMTPAASLAYVMTWTPLVNGQPDRRRSIRSSELLGTSPEGPEKAGGNTLLSFSLREFAEVPAQEKQIEIKEKAVAGTNGIQKSGSTPEQSASDTGSDKESVAPPNLCIRQGQHSLSYRRLIAPVTSEKPPGSPCP
jgi:hypothetical protein